MASDESNECNPSLSPEGRRPFIDLNIECIDDQAQPASDIETSAVRASHGFDFTHGNHNLDHGMLHEFDLNDEPDEGNIHNHDLPNTDGELFPDENTAPDNTLSRELTNGTRKRIYEALLSRSASGKLHKQDTRAVGESFSVRRRTVQRIWKQGKECVAHGDAVDVCSRKSRNVGRKKVEVDLSTLSDLPMSSRSTLEDLTNHFNVGKTKLWQLKKEGLIKRRSNSIKPLLTEQNKKQRSKWCISMLDPISIPRNPVFKCLFDVVFIDEKWFYLTKWPREDASRPIYIQQDNARPHIDPNDPAFREAATQDGFDIHLMCQPPNSPDFNVLDLVFFAGIQAKQCKKSAKTVAELVPVVQEAFEEYSVCQSNRIFLTYHLVMIEAMKVGGGNGYKIPHIKKGTLERQGILPLQIECDPQLVQDALREVNEQD